MTPASSRAATGKQLADALAGLLESAHLLGLDPGVARVERTRIPHLAAPGRTAGWRCYCPACMQAPVLRQRAFLWAGRGGS